MSFEDYEETYDEEEEEESDPDYRGGFFLVPIREEQQAAQIILQFLEHTDEPIVKSYFKDGAIVNEHVPRPEYAAHPTLGMVELTLADEFELLVNFGPSLEGYYSIFAEAHRVIFGGFTSEPTDVFLNRMRRFVRAWVRVCESIHAEFASFSNGSQGTTEKWRNEAVLPALHPLDPEDLLFPMAWSYWLMYLGPHLVSQIPAKDLQALKDIKMTTLPSGALVLRNRLSPLLLKDEALYEAFFEQEIDLK